MSRFLTHRRRLTDRLRQFTRSRGANVSILFAFSLIPMLGLVGMGVDYGVALADKSKLDNAADSAAIAAVATAKAYVAANQSDANLTADAISAGLTRATNAFSVNSGNVAFATVTAPTITLVRVKQTFTASVSYNASVQNHFGQLFGSPTIPVASTVTASADIPSYLDFYLLIDVSESMALPSTIAGQNALMAGNGGCQFACHFPGQDGGYNYAVANGIQLRTGAVNNAVCGLLTLAATPSVKNQYRVGVYPFIDQMATLVALTYADTNATKLATKTGCNTSNPGVFTGLLDTGTTQLYTGHDPSTGTGAGGTHFETTLSSVQQTISSYGDGSSSTNSRPFVFIVTDGMQNSQHYQTVVNGKVTYPGSPSNFSGYADAWWDGSSPQAMDGSLCSSLKQQTPNAATISILYIPYTTMTVTNQNTWEIVTANAALPSIPAALQQCATPGYFYTANTPTDINNALANMFNQAIQAAHLSK